MTATFPCLDACTKDDLVGIAEIERLSFSTPWAVEAFAEELTRPWARLEVLRRARGEKPLGFSNYWLVADEVQIINIAVHPDARRQGFAGLLLDHIIEQAKRACFRVLSLEVRMSNTPAQSLYRKFGFKDVGMRPRYYADNGENALLMDLNLTA
jgi:ribosomal-protein-alanine N-acetyltransferase